GLGFHQLVRRVMAGQGSFVGSCAGIDEIGTGQVAGWGYRSAAGLASGSLGGVTLRLYDTATRSEREVSPVEPGEASLYLCGATVQAPPTIRTTGAGARFHIVVRSLKRS